MQISVSYLSSYYSREKTIKLIEETTADYIHVDLMDGGFVPKKNFEIKEVVDLLKECRKKLDIHLMTFDPILYIEALSKLEPQYITFHLEATKDIIKTIKMIKNYNIKVGISIKPNTNLLELMPYISLVDLVLIMSVEPGCGGQDFLLSSLKRLEDLKEIRKNNDLSFKIEMDGGINAESIKLVKGLDIAVSGSFICKSTNYEQQINLVRENIKKN